MKFKTAVKRTNEVRDAYRPGIEALRERDRNRLSFEDTRQIRGSINLDDSLAVVYPNQPRWDYGIGIEKKSAKDQVFWLEVHPAKADEIAPMIAKLKWLKNWLQNSAPNLQQITVNDSPFIWIASGHVTFQQRSAQAKLLAKAGVTFPREHYHFKIS